MGLWAALAAIGFASTAADGWAQGDVATPADPHVHRQTGVAFPRSIGPFQRTRVTTYTADGADTGVGYDLIRDGRKIGTVSIFVYPGPDLPDDASEAAKGAACASVFAGIRGDILSSRPDAKQVDARSVPAPSPVFRTTGLWASYAGSGKLAGVVQPVHDESYLYCFAGGRWLVAYRLTSMAGVDVAADATSLMRSIVWPGTLAR